MGDNGTFHGVAEAACGTVGDAMTTSVVTLTRAMRASDAARALSDAGVAGGPVVEGGVVVGIITLRDLLEREGSAQQSTGPFLRGERRLVNLTVGDTMTREVFTARTDWPLTRAITLMDEARVNRLPVLDAGGRPVGILARDDVLRAVARALRESEAAEAAAAARERTRIEPD
jgi:CBS domain-containing membrane protein